MSALQRWTKGIAYALGMSATWAAFYMADHYFAGEPLLLNRSQIATVCAAGVFYLSGFFSGSKAERKAGAEVIITS